MLYGPGVLWLVVGGGGGGPTNLYLTPKAVSGAPGALSRKPTRSPWIGRRMRQRHTHRFVHANTLGRKQSRFIRAGMISTFTHRQTHTCINIDRRANTEVVTLYSLYSLTHIHTLLLPVRNLINILGARRDASMCLQGLLQTSSLPPSPLSYWEVSFLSQSALG